jgi:hypothetical protein
MEVNIYNQCSDFDLIDGEYFISGADWVKYPVNAVDAGSMTNATLIPSPITFEGVLAYGLLRKNVESGNQHKSTYILLFVAWKSEGYREFHVFVHVIECDKKIKWNQIKLDEYYQRYANQFSTYAGPIKDTWLMYDGTVLMTGLDLDFMQRDGVLNTTISEGVKGEHTRRPEWIDLNR